MKRSIAMSRACAMVAVALAAVPGCATSASGWTLEPNDVGVASGDPVARYQRPVESGVDGFAREVLEPLGLVVPASATGIEGARIEFEANPGWLVRDASLIRMTLPRADVERLLNREQTGVSFGTISTVQNAISPSVADILGERFDATYPATVAPVVPLDPDQSTREVVAVAPPGDPVEMVFLVYDVPE